jgi:peptidoglycan hydrolase-like protein with peptidoglycan-binding domain
MHVVWFACPGEPGRQVKEAYRAALEPLGDFTIEWITPAGGRRAFRSHGQALRRDGRVVPRLLERHPVGSVESISLVAFGAGGGLAEEIVAAAEDRAALDGLVLLDALAGDDDAEAALFGLAEYAALARRGEACLAIGHVDLDGPRGTRPNNAVAQLVRESGAAHAPAAADTAAYLAEVADGDFVVRAYDLFGEEHPRKEHAAALTSWGADLVAQTLVPALLRPRPVVEAPAGGPPRAPGPAAARPTLRRGAEGPLVVELQELLGISADGSFGPQTERAVRRFQAGNALAVDGVVGPRTWEALERTRPPTEEIVSGIDISHFQPVARFDWDRIAVDHRFMIARAVYGRRRDETFAGHVAGARAAGLAVGAYVFFRQGQRWEEQFDALRAAIDAAGMRAGDLVPAVDLESNPFDGPLDKDAHNSGGRKLTEAIAERWGGALVYLAPGHWLQLGRPAWITEHHVWTAHWGVDKPAWPTDWALWQVSESHVHPGFRGGPLDLDKARRLPKIR